MSHSDQTFSETMRRVRKAQNLTLDGLQKKTGIPLPRLRSIDSGEVSPYLLEADRIAAALHTTIDALVHGTITTYALGAFRNIAERLPVNNKCQEGESNT